CIVNPLKKYVCPPRALAIRHALMCSGSVPWFWNSTYSSASVTGTRPTKTMSVKARLADGTAAPSANPSYIIALSAPSASSITAALMLPGSVPRLAAMLTEYCVSSVSPGTPRGSILTAAGGIKVTVCEVASPVRKLRQVSVALGAVTQNGNAVSPFAYLGSKTHAAPGASALPRANRRVVPPPSGVNAIAGTTAAPPTFWTTIVDVVFARPLSFAFFAAYAPYAAKAALAIPSVAYATGFATSGSSFWVLTTAARGWVEVIVAAYCRPSTSPGSMFGSMNRD